MVAGRPRSDDSCQAPLLGPAAVAAPLLGLTHCWLTRAFGLTDSPTARYYHASRVSGLLSTIFVDEKKPAGWRAGVALVAVTQWFQTHWPCAQNIQG